MTADELGQSTGANLSEGCRISWRGGFAPPRIHRTIGQDGPVRTGTANPLRARPAGWCSVPLRQPCIVTARGEGVPREETFAPTRPVRQPQEKPKWRDKRNCLWRHPLCSIGLPVLWAPCDGSAGPLQTSDYLATPPFI
jgi:hypothetical protein